MPQDSEKAMGTGIVSEFLNNPLTVEKVQEIIDKFF
jgi:hypothetical protein